MTHARKLILYFDNKIYEYKWGILVDRLFDFYDDDYISLNTIYLIYNNELVTCIIMYSSFLNAISWKYQEDLFCKLLELCPEIT